MAVARSRQIHMVIDDLAVVHYSLKAVLHSVAVLHIGMEAD